MKPIFLLSLFFLACSSAGISASAFADSAQRTVYQETALPQGSGPGSQPAATTDTGKTAKLSRKIAVAAFFTRHFVTSHSTSLLLRPVASVRNLLALTFTTTTGMLKDVALDTVLFPRLDDHAIAPLATTQSMDLDKWEEELDRITNTRRTRGSLDFLIDGEAFFRRLTAAIASSQDSIRIRTYIFDNDDFALEIADLLKARSAEIPVEILVDGIGTLGGGLITSTSVPEDFVAPVSIKSYLEKDSSVNLHMLNNTWLMGDHTKTFIFDDKVAFLGGMNIDREYRYDWHDLMVELSGPIVDQLSFDAAKAAEGPSYPFNCYSNFKGLGVNGRAPGTPSGLQGGSIVAQAIRTRNSALPTHSSSHSRNLHYTTLFVSMVGSVPAHWPN